MSQKLLTEDIRKKIPPLYSQENVKDPIVHVKFFTPWTQWTWYATEFDGKDIFFGWVVGLEKELGYFSLSEMESVRGPGGIMIERDMYFDPKPLSEVMADHGERFLPQVRKPQNESKKRPLYPHVPKNRQPQFPHVPKGRQPSEKLPQTLPQTGTCYANAWRFLIKEEEGELIHGTLFSGGRRMGHAWVETPTGWVWEPETGNYFTVLGFKDAFAPVIESRYTAEEAAIMVARTKHLGPWSEQERVQYLGVRHPQTIELLASTEGDPIRKFCCRLCGECAPKELLEEGRFLDRISWLRGHYQAKHPGMWGKMSPMTVEDGELVSPEYRHLASLVREPLPKEAY